MAQQATNIEPVSHNSEVTRTLQLLDEGEQGIELNEQLKNLTLVLGNTGAGKTTFVQWIAGDNDRLFAKEVVRGSGEFIIVDGNRIGNNTIQSATFFPELVIDSENKTSYYDCPGFSDTRSTSHEIVVTYFIKKVLDHSANIKIVLIVSYPSVRKGVDRQDFIQLMRHSTDMIKDIDKFRKSIAIVVTKVDNKYIKEGGNYNIVSDEKVIQTIAVFLLEVKQGLIERLEIDNLSFRDKTFYERAMKLVDILLTKNGDKYTKIGIFRRPNIAGVLSNIDVIQEGKTHIKKMLYESLELTAKDDDDFGYTVSERAKNDINNLVEAINNNVWFNVSNLVQNVKEHYHIFFEQVQKKIESIVTNTDTIFLERYETELFVSKFNELNVIFNMMEEVKDLTSIKHLVDKLKNGFNNTDVKTNIYEKHLSNLSNQGKYFEFLQIVSNGQLKLRTWEILFQNFRTYISDSQQDIQNNIIHSAEQIKTKIYSIIKHLAIEVMKHYRKKIEVLEIQKLPNVLHQGHNVILNIISEIESQNNVQALSKNIEDNLAKLDVNEVKMRSAVSFISLQAKYLQFLELLSTVRLHTWSPHWVNLFKEVANFLHNSEKWYIFLDDVYTKFSDYQVQENTSKYNVANIEDWGLPNKPQGLLITPNTFHHFLDKIRQYNVKEYDAVREIEVNELQLQELNKIADLTLRHRVNATCLEPDKLVIMGEYVKFSDFIKTDGDIENACRNIATLKSINIFALNTVFIDRNLNGLGKTLKVGVVAPKWKVIDDKEIILDGSPAAAHSPTKARNGYHAGNKGSDGLPGLPGGSAGSLLGIGREFINDGKLIISVNGGKGGPGQDGGDGATGQNGVSAATPSGCHHDSNYQETNYQRDYEIYPLWHTNTEHRTYRSDGSRYGGKGGVGGNGGIGGIGGNSGNVILHFLENEPGIPIWKSKGSNGDSGEGGIGLPGGENGKEYEKDCETHTVYVLFFIPIKNTKLQWIRSIDKGRASAGENGSKGFNKIGQVFPETPIVLEEASVMNDYKSYLRENLRNRWTRNTLKHFFDQLNNNIKFRNIYNTLGLVNELHSLENQLHKLNKDDIIMAYEFLLNRIRGVQINQNLENNTQHKKVLNYLYTTVLSRMSNERSNSEESLIINVSKYMDFVKDNIKILSNLQEQSNKIKIINDYKENYKSHFDKKIEEANNYIETYLKLGIHDTSIEIDNEIDILINKIIKLQDRASGHKQELINKRKRLEHMLELGNKLNLRSLLSVLKKVGGVLGFLGPIGRTIGTVIGTTATITESLILDDRSRQNNTLKLPSTITSELRQIKHQVEDTACQNYDTFYDLLRDILQETNKFPETLSAAVARIADIMGRLETMTHEEKCNYETINELGDELKQELKGREGELRNETLTVNQSTSNELSVIVKSMRALQLGILGFDTYTKYKNDEVKLETINEAIRQADNEIQDLKQYELIIYDTISPMLKTMKEDLNDTTGNLQNKGEIALHVTNWKVQRFLKDIKIKIHQATERFNVQNNILQYIETLEESITTLINIYNRIQNYEEQVSLSAYIADISSTAADNIHITDPTLSIAVSNLEIQIRSNLILSQYNTAIAAFQQWVFPFAHLYVSDFALGSHLHLDINNTLRLAEDRIERIKSKMDNYKISVQSHDQILYQGKFSSNFTRANAFFVWENKKYKNIISKLLSGEKVVAKSNVINSPNEKDAIKFNVIDINFRSENATIQSEIYNKMKAFKISATHLGNSYYRYNNKFYVITGSSQNIQYSFERDGNGDPIHSNNVYRKIKDGDFMLSPYTMWEFQLISPENRFPFHDLAMYKDDVSLELVGYGNYISGKSDLRAENYYHVDDTLYEMYSKHEWQESSSTNMVLQTNETRLFAINTRGKRSVKTRNDNTNLAPTPSKTKRLSFQPSDTLSKTYSTSKKSSLIDQLHSYFAVTPMPFFGTKSPVEIDIKSDVTRLDHQAISHRHEHAYANTENHNLQEPRYYGDARGNFVLGQMIAGLIFGKNKSLSGVSYISPEHKRNMEINALAQRILPVLKIDEGCCSDDDEY